MKKIVLTICQIALTAGILFWVFRDPSKRSEMAETLQNANMVWLLLAVVLFGVLQIFGMARWFILLRAVGIIVAPWRIACLYLIGIFFNLFMLGSTGGDVVKIFYIFREAPAQKSAAFTSVVVDRVVGLMALILLTAGLVLLKFQWLTSNEVAANYVYALLAVLAAAIGGLGFVVVITWLNLAHKLPQWTPLRAKLIEVSDALQTYGRTPGTLAVAFAISIVGHCTFFFVFFLLALAFGANVPWVEFFSIMPIVATFTALPITFGGLGVREKLFEHLLGGLSDVPVQVATLIGSGGFIVAMLWALVGGVVYVLYRSAVGVPKAAEAAEALEKPSNG